MATSELTIIVIPPFIKSDPALWFHLLEAPFDLASPKSVKESKTKYNYVLAHIPPEIATVLRDVIMQHDSTDPYTELKQQIISRCSESKTDEIQRLLADGNLGDRKPSELP
ncbi:uncharacterized protein NPIL_658231 [Nephila pilipes]|uniref:DUF7041 domain-containing protein n=1 Tax=Nephila pilipes TaxID=299642 RepID=A0A8X6P1F0_NEPPI|nr:uncharacterized protein NPIL_658231 [Nephila pilipes]